MSDNHLPANPSLLRIGGQVGHVKCPPLDPKRQAIPTRSTLPMRTAQPSKTGNLKAWIGGFPTSAARQLGQWAFRPEGLQVLLVD